MRHKPILWVIIIIVLLLCASSAAHPGRTDEDGGHRDSGTGEYHYHHGYPAHQHENGVCPYNYDDRTGWNSGSASSSKSTKTPEPEVIIEYVEVPVEVEVEKEQGKTALYLLGGVAGIATLYAIKKRKDARVAVDEKSKIADQKDAELQAKTEELEAAKLDLAQEHEKRMRQLASMDELLLFIRQNGCLNPDSVIPSGSAVGLDGLPCDAQTSLILPWGAHYTFFVTQGGKAFHTFGCQHLAHKGLAENAFRVRNMEKCHTCNPKLPDLSWYDEYKRLEKLKNKYNL